MTEVGITEFRASCPALLERVRKTGQSIVVTRFGRPVARIVPPPRPEGPTEPQRKSNDRLGCMEDLTEIKGDIVGPVFDASDRHSS